MRRDLETDAVMDRFAGGLMAYMSEYFSSVSGGIYKPYINYSIPNAEYISENWVEICSELRSLKPVYEYSSELNVVAKDYLPVFLKEHPWLSDEKCLKLY